MGSLYLTNRNLHLVNSLCIIAKYLFPSNISNKHNVASGPGSSVGITTGYGLDGPRIETPWRRDFLHLSRPVMGPTQPPVQLVPRLFRA